MNESLDLSSSPFPISSSTRRLPQAISSKPTPSLLSTSRRARLRKKPPSLATVPTPQTPSPRLPQSASTFSLPLSPSRSLRRVASHPTRRLKKSFSTRFSFNTSDDAKPGVPSLPRSPAVPSPPCYTSDMLRGPSPPPLGPREAALADSLIRESVDECLAALDEYAWRSLLAGLRVREYCAAATHAVHNSPPKGLRLALASTSTRILYPFALPAGSPSTPSSVSSIPAHAFPHLTRRQVVDALCRLACTRDHNALIEARVFELVLEYVGRRWRAEGGAVDSIAKKLADVEVEVLQNEPLSRGVVIPALQELRFQLGLVDAPHLVGRLSLTRASRSTGETTQLVSAWTVRRLNAGVEPQAVADDLAAVRECLAVPGRDAISEVLVTFCLDGRASIIPAEPRTRTRTLSRLSLRTAKRRTLPLPQWLSPRPIHNGTARLQQAEGERRPSLPTTLMARTSEPSLPQTPRTPTTPRLGTPTSDSSSQCSTPSSVARQPSRQASPLEFPPVTFPGAPDVTCNLPTERVALVDHLLSLRYRLGPDADSWHLGCGRFKACNFLDGVEAAAAEDSKDIVEQLRHAFGLAALLKVAEDQPTPTRTTFHQRDVSFDLEQYITALGPLEGDTSVHLSTIESLGSNGHEEGQPHVHALGHHPHTSMSTLSSVLTAVSTGAASAVSEFVICEATRETPVARQAVAYLFPPKTADEMSFGHGEAPPLSYKRFAKSMPNVHDSYTRLPERPPRRRRSTKESLPPLLPAFEGASDVASFEGKHNTTALGLLGLRPSSEITPQLTPPHSPLLEQKLYSFPPQPLHNSHEPLESPPTPRHQSIGGGERIRRQKFRQCVIVDGASMSPQSSIYTTPSSGSKEATPLGIILALFSALGCEGAEVSTEEVEKRLLEAVTTEAARLMSQGERFDAEARARLAWLLEQVGQELASPNLVAAVHSVLDSISSKTPSSDGHASGPRNLTIVVPPRHAGDFAVGIAPPSASPSPPSGPSDVSYNTASTSPPHTPSVASCASSASHSPLQGKAPLPPTLLASPSMSKRLARRSALRHPSTHTTPVTSPAHTPSHTPAPTPGHSPKDVSRKLFSSPRLSQSSTQASKHAHKPSPPPYTKLHHNNHQHTPSHTKPFTTASTILTHAL